MQVNPIATANSHADPAARLPQPSALPTAGGPFDAILAGTKADIISKPSIGQRFEAASLATFLTHLLPSSDSSVWGGQSGNLWRGLFAEHLADQVSQAGGVGIAQVIDQKVNGDPPTNDSHPSEKGHQA